VQIEVVELDRDPRRRRRAGGETIEAKLVAERSTGQTNEAAGGGRPLAGGRLLDGDDQPGHISASDSGSEE
jgi:hypothetical protein